MANRPTAASLQGPFAGPALGIDLNHEAFPSTTFDPEAFEAHLRAYGVGCLYRRAILCPCHRLETSRGRSGCLICHGLGYAYPEAEEEPITALITGRSVRRAAKGVGEVAAGTCTITFPSGIIPTQGDQVFPDGEEHVVTQVLRRALAQVDPAVVRERATHPSHQAPTVAAVTERLLYPDVTRIETVTWVVDERGPGERLGYAREGLDFTRDRNVLRWQDGRGPEPGRGFSVRYRAPACYIVGIDVEPAMRTTDPGVPYRCEARRLDRRGEPDLR